MVLLMRNGRLASATCAASEVVLAGPHGAVRTNWALLMHGPGGAVQKRRRSSAQLRPVQRS